MKDGIDIIKTFSFSLASRKTLSKLTKDSIICWLLLTRIKHEQKWKHLLELNYTFTGISEYEETFTVQKTVSCCG